VLSCNQRSVNLVDRPALCRPDRSRATLSEVEGEQSRVEGSRECFSHSIPASGSSHHSLPPSAEDAFLLLHTFHSFVILSKPERPTGVRGASKDLCTLSFAIRRQGVLSMTSIANRTARVPDLGSTDCPAPARREIMEPSLKASDHAPRAVLACWDGMRSRKAG
jgi:hypothetical protein